MTGQQVQEGETITKCWVASHEMKGHGVWRTGHSII